MLNVLNKRCLVDNGLTALEKKARKLAIEGFEAALKAVDPTSILESRVTVQNSILKVDAYTYNLENYGHIYVVGGGKASGKMAEALESILGNQITSGIVNIPRDSEPYHTQRIKLNEAGHPLPDIAGLNGAKEILDVVSQAEEDDLIICLISGGGSSLMPLPRGDVTIQDKQETTDLLLKSGATINEVNTVRKHISGIKGGWLAKNAFPATILNLILSDVIGDPLDSIASGPMVPDSTSFSDAVEVLRRHKLWGRIPESVQILLENGVKGLISETPKEGDEAFRNIHNVIIGNNRTATTATSKKLQDAGLRCLVLTSLLEGEAKEVGVVLASIAREIVASGKPLPRPCGIIAGGETTVAVSGGGRGGRNQEIALSAALKISGMEGVVIASMSTDGMDGPTDAAGAIADGKTVLRSREQGLNAERFLKNNDSYTFFSKLDDLVISKLTGTNVNDISVIIAV